LQKNSDKTVRSISPAALEQLYRYRFPGNVRELQNAIERAFTFSRDDKIAVEDLPQRILDSEHESEVDYGTEWPTLDEYQNQYIRKVLSHAEGNKSKAAEILGVTRRTLYRWLEQHGE
jgi:DNA-binding NtrC family response regulator